MYHHWVIESIMADWEQQLEKFNEIRKKYLVY